MPVPSELHIDRWLTDLSVAYIQGEDAFISDKVFPVVPVQKQSDKFIVYDRGSFWRDQLKERPLGGRADVAEWTKSESTYACVEKALAHKIDDRQYANTDSPLNLDRQAMNLLSSAVAIHNDKLWAAKYFTSGVWTTDLIGSGGTPDFTQFDDATSPADPIQLVDAQKSVVRELTAVTPNTLVVGEALHRHFRLNTSIVDRIKYTQRGIADTDLLAQMFGVDKYIVATGVSNTAKEGQTDSFSYMVDSKDMLLVYAAPAPGLDTPSGGYTFAWTGLLGGAANAMGGVFQRGRDEFAHSNHFEVRVATDVKLVAPDLGVFIEDCIS